MRKKGNSAYLNSTCRDCDKALYKEYRENNREKVRETKRKWARKNKDKKAEMDRRYRKKMGKKLYERREELMKQKKYLEKSCKICEESYFSYNSLKKYCSRKCFTVSQKESRKKKGNPNYRNGKGVLAKQWSVNRKKFKENFIEKNGFLSCERCKKALSNDIFVSHVHHIVYRSEAPKHENIHNLLNFLLVCVKCHSWFHQKKDRRDYLVKERKLWELFPEFEYLKKTNNDN